MEDRVVIGVVRKTHGVRGHFKVTSLSGEYKHFLDLETLGLRINSIEKDYQVEEVKPFGREILMKLKGIDSPEDARKLATGEIIVPKRKAAPLGKGEFYQSDLIGCRLFHEEKDAGQVLSVFDGAQSDLLEVRNNRGTFLVPFMKEYIGAVDLKGKSIELLAPWLME